MKTLISISILVASLPTLAQVVDYTPFQFKDTSLYQRADVKKELARQHYKIQNVDQSYLVWNSETDVTMRLFPETQRLMQLARDAGKSPVAAIQPLTSCVEHAAAVQIQVQPNCAALAQVVTAMSAQQSKVCRDVARPEAYMAEVAPVAPFNKDRFAKADILGLMEAAGQLMMQQTWPSGLITQDMADRGRKIILKLRYATVKNNIQAQQSYYQAALQQVSAAPSCVSDAAAVQNKFRNLSNELNAASALVESNYQAGINQAAADRVRISSTGKIRDPLPYPSLSDSDREFVSFYLSGVYWRMRGGGLIGNMGTKDRRRYFTQNTFEKLVDMNCGSKCSSGIKDIGGKMRFKLEIKGWGDWADMGQTVGGDDRYHDVTFMTWRGEFQVDSSVSALNNAKFSGTPLFLAGVHMGPIFYYGTHLPIRSKVVNADPYLNLGSDGWSWGEVLYGSTLGLGLAKSLLPGHNR